MDTQTPDLQAVVERLEKVEQGLSRLARRQTSSQCLSLLVVMLCFFLLFAVIAPEITWRTKAVDTERFTVRDSDGRKRLEFSVGELRVYDEDGKLIWQAPPPEDAPEEEQAGE